MTRPRDIVYPVFLQASQHATDDYWKFLIQELAYKSLPYGVYLDQRVSQLCSTTKTTRVTCSFAGVSSAVLHERLLEFFRALGMRSSREYVEQHAELRHLYTNQYPDWVSIKKKYVKELLLYNYVIALRAKYNLTHHQVKLLLSNIMLWFQFKLLNKFDVVFDAASCRILSIKDVRITKNGRIRLHRSLEQLQHPPSQHG
jgi:hypothetical protein